MAIERVRDEKDIPIRLIHPDTGEYLGSIVIDVKELWYRPERKDGFTEEECKVLEYSRDVYCWAQKAVGVPSIPDPEVKNNE